MSTKKLHHNRYLPEEIIVQILCRLPMKPLIRFSSVSKRWRYLIIKDPQFAQSHFKLASDRKTLTQRLLISTDYQIRSLDPETPSFADNNSSLNNLTFAHFSNLVGCCNGLVCVDVDGYEKHDLSLWNPSTGFKRKLPDSDFACAVKNVSRFAESDIGRSGLGYVSSTDDYKIFIDADVYSKPLQTFMEIYSSRLNSWKPIQVREHDPPCSFRSPTTSSMGALLNEALHWFYRKVGEEEPTILAFDLAKEEFREVPFPTFDGDADDVDVHYMGVQVVSRGGGECLCVSIARRRGGVNFMEFWVMREYGVRESWTMLFKFNTDHVSEAVGGNLHGYEAIFVTEGGTVVFRLRFRDRLVRIECRREAEPVCSTPFNVNDGDGPVYNVIAYNETLFSVPKLGLHEMNEADVS
ncbi:PREDICTED: F-box/kelch-repeat protein At3g23880-like [Prunus mume]|uniref:F-box/kelch-repeat protein At3g23880-like n=1 Tax=Prunus mume TaxID=102107 RepID=A0ABM0P4T3_PRUMU|nr:PREDICTED: F-box/kelch-repeat protein At3g23880-like [Prunus mume]